MGIFNRNEERLDLIQKTQNNLELSQKNTELVLSTLTQLSGNHISNKEEIYDDVQKRRAAHALNLCSVSVSQIVDYNDIYILEQEYALILNNLNLENMPKDEALLNILKQILDTITFFKIQEGDKKFIEKEYQEKMKSAIWSAVPNVGMAIVSGDPIIAMTSLASQVGIGYMNYRKEKAKAGLELDKQKWQLQRSAIEQFHGLRRELFDTAWRLADKYQFPDDYRLTEKQITLYNEILMETHPIKKYERLFAIKDKFEAYPSFIYQIGNAANDIYQSNRYDDSIKERYKFLAKTYFEEYLNINKYDLLRENHIASSCALEYIDLLDVNSERNKIEELMKYAIKSSGDANDVLELCAIEYLKLGYSREASIILKRLVNEDYNAVVNAQLLSNIYVSEYINTRSVNVKDEYTFLRDLVNPNYLFPMPLEDYENPDELSQCFLKFQKQILIEKYLCVLSDFVSNYTIKFNEVIPKPETKKHFKYSFSDDEESRNSRMKIINNTLMGAHANEYLNSLERIDIEIEFLNVLNEMYFNVIKLKSLSDRDADSVKEALLTTYSDNKADLDAFRENIKIKDYPAVNTALNRYTFKFFTEGFFIKLLEKLNVYIYHLHTMDEIMNAEGILRKFCIEQNIIVPEMLYSQNAIENVAVENYIFEVSLGDLEEKKEKKDIFNKMEACIKERMKDIAIEKSKYISSSTVRDKFIFNQSFDKKQLIGYLDDKRIIKEKDLYFTTEKIHIVRRGVEMASAYYSDIVFDEKGNRLCVDEYQVYDNVEELMSQPLSFSFTEKSDRVSKLADLIKELAEINPNAKSKHTNEGEYSDKKLIFKIENNKLILNESQGI